MDVEVGDICVEEGLVGLPARVSRVEWGDERVGAAEVVGLDETEALEDVATLAGRVDGWGLGAVGEAAEDCEVEWT